VFPSFPPTKEKELKFLQIRIAQSYELGFESTRSAIDGRVTPDGNFLITWNGSPDVTIWNIEERAEETVLQVAPQALYDLAMSPTGGYLATAGDDGVVKFWDLNTRDLRPTKKDYIHPKIDFVRFSPDGKYLITGSDDGLLKVWDAPEFIRIPEIKGLRRMPFGHDYCGD
jgi:WD40 repeat protein